MRHRRLRRKLGVKSAHRKALLKNLVQSLIKHKRIQTTLPKAKEASSYIEQMMRLARKADLHARRQLISKIGDERAVNTLIRDIAPRMEGRQGGYTRVLRMQPRAGDGAQMALLEFTVAIEPPETKKKKAKKKTKTAPKASEDSASTQKSKKDDKKADAEQPSVSDQERKEAEKKGGFLGTLRKFLKGDE